MSPRYVPPKERRELIPAATSWSPLGPAEPDPALEAVVAAQTPRRAATVDPYDQRSGYSYFRDLLREAEARERSAKALESASLRGRDQGEGPIAPGLRADGTLADVRERLRFARDLAQYERRDLSSSGAQSALAPGGVPSFVARAFATAARTRSKIAAVLPTEALPEQGLEVNAPRFTSGVGVAAHTENAAVQETDPVTALATSTVGYIAGNVDLSRQLFDRSSLMNFDRALAAELGAALATALDDAILHGSGTAPNLRGLQNVSGITSVSKTNASPTASTNLAAIGDLVAQTAAAYGAQPTHLVMHSRRYDWLVTKLGYAPAWPVENIVVSNAISTTISTNQDEIFAIVADELWLFRNPPTIAVYPQIGSATLAVRVQARQAAGLLANRLPAAIGRLTGSELAAPTF